MRGVIRGFGAKANYWIDGREVTKDAFDRAFPPVKEEPGEHAGSSLVGFKPIQSEALAVHPRQVAGAREDAIKKGVPTDFLPDGRPVLRTRQHRAEYLRAYGFFDRDAGYGDPADGSFRGR